MNEFGSLSSMFAAGPAAQARIVGDIRVVSLIETVRDMILCLLRRETATGPILSDSHALLNYLHFEMGHCLHEKVRVLFLDSQNRLLRDEVVALGSINEAPIYPREIMRRALEVNATALILVHNHPSGDPTPTAGDIEATKRIAQATRVFDIILHDHVVVARSGSTSFRSLGLL